MASTYKTLIRTTALLATLCAIASTGCESGGETVGPRGGTLVSEDGRFSVDIPAGALDADVDLAIDEVECAVGEALGSCYAVSPIGTTFLRPVEVAYELGDMDVGEDIAVIGEAADGWRVLPDRGVDLDDAVVYASVLYLSEYGVAEID